MRPAASRSPPTFEALAEELGDKVKVVKLNIDDNPLTAGRFGVRGLPTFMIFQDGKVDRHAPWRDEQGAPDRVAQANPRPSVA